MSELDDLRAEAQSELRANAGLLYRHSATWSDGTTCRFSVQDPSKDARSGPQKLSTSPLDASLRRLKVHPDDVMPAPGASTPYQGGLLVRGSQTDTSDFTGLSTGVCILIDSRLADFPPRLTDGPLFFLAFLPYLQAGMGEQITLVRPGVPDPNAPVDGRGHRPRTQDSRVTVPGLLYQPDLKQRAALAGAQLAIPAWQLLLPFSAPVNPADFQVEDSTGRRFQVVGVPRDEDGKGVVWVIDLAAPGAR